MPVGHPDSYGYPTSEQFAEQVGNAFQIVTGQAPPGWTVADKVKTFHTVASGALGFAFPHDGAQPFRGPDTAKMGDDELASRLTASLRTVQETAGGEGMKAIDWAFWVNLASQILEFIKRLV